MSIAARLLATRLLAEAEPEPEPTSTPEPAPGAAPFSAKDWIVHQDIAHGGSPDPTYYQHLADQLGTRNKRKLDYATYLIRHDDGNISIRLHVTDIITARRDGLVIVNTYGTPNPKHMYGFNRMGHQHPGFGETARSWRVPFTRNKLNNFLPCGWKVYAQGKSEIPTPYGQIRTKAHAQNWWWHNTASRSGGWDGPGFRIPFSDYDIIDTKTGELKSRLPPVPLKGRASNPKREIGWGHDDEFFGKQGPELAEGKKLAPNWTETSGIFADLSDWPTVEYYAKCPKCGHVHGNYKTMREAHMKRLCQSCSLETINKIKDVVAHVDDPGMTRKSISRIVGESDIDVKSHILQYGENWVWQAISDLEAEESVHLELEDEEDLENPDNVTSIKVKTIGGDSAYTIYKDESVAEEAAVARVRDQISSEPENWNWTWLSNYLDKDKLKRELLMDYNGLDIREDDVSEQVTWLIGRKWLEEDDFYTSTGRFRKITPRLQRLIDDAIERAEDDYREKFDPEEYFQDIYGEDEWVKEALKMAPLVGDKLEQAAKDAVREDHWSRFLAQDDRYFDLDAGAVAVKRY